MGILGRISEGLIGRKGEEVGSGEEESLYGAEHKVFGGEEEKRPEPEEKPVPTPKAQAPSPWQVGDVIRLDWGYANEVREIKGGGMGRVYICKEEDGTPIVLKTFQGKYLENKAATERFKWEAEVWVRLGRHRNIVRATTTDTVGGYTFVLLEYVPGDELYGPDLSGWIRKGGLSIDLALDFAVQFCTGMIHAREVFDRDPTLKPPFVHRDIKPQNILITRDRVVKVTDFGLVKAFALLEGEIEAEAEDEWGQKRHSFTKKGWVCGTLPYIAPDIWREKEIDERADIYSFGCTLYEMLSGFPPFVYDTRDPEKYEKYQHAHLNLSPRPIPGVPEEINALVFRCLEKDRERRYPSFESLREALAGLYYRRTGERLTWREETDPESQAADWLAKGNGLVRLGFQREAIECYDLSIQLNPSYAGAYCNRGNTYDELDQYERAIADFDEAIRLNPGLAEAYNGRGAAYRRLDQYERAIADYDEALRLNPHYAIAYYNRGNAYKNLSQYELAIADHDEALRLNPSYVFAYNSRGNAYRDLGQHERAIADHDEALRLNPKYALAYNNRGMAYLKLDQYERAIADYDEALRLDPSFAMVYSNKALRLQEMERYPEALATYKKYLEVARGTLSEKERIFTAEAQIEKLRKELKKS